MFRFEKYNFENHKSKCRCCLLEFGKEDAQIKVTEIVEERFREITQIELKNGDNYSNVICEQCNIELRSFISYRRTLVNKQTSLYDFVDAAIKNLSDSVNEVVAVEKDAPVCIELAEGSTENVNIKIEAENYLSDEDEEKVRHSKADQVLLLNFSSEKKLNFLKRECTVVLERCDSFVDKHRRRSGEDKVQVKEKLCPTSYALPQSVKDRINRKHANFPKLRTPPVVPFVRTFVANPASKKLTRATNNDKHCCNYCKKGFSTPDLLELHMKSHVKAEFKCQFAGCQKSYVMNWRLKAHEKTHMGTHIPEVYHKLFYCPDCHASFTLEANMRRHMKTHHYKDQTSFPECHLCEKSFTSSQSIKRHIAAVHDRFQINCMVKNCRFSTALKGHLKRHIVCVHRELSEGTKNAYLEKLFEKKLQPVDGKNKDIK